MIENLVFYINKNIDTSTDDFNTNHFAGILWTNILANIVSIFIIISTTITVTYLILNAILKFKINSEIKKLLSKGFLISNLENMTFFSLIEYIKIINEEELTKRLKKKFTSESFGKTDSIENQMSLYKNVFTNFRTYRRLTKWNKSTDILKHNNKDIFKKITNLSIAFKDKNFVFVYQYEGQEYSLLIKKGFKI